MKTRFILSAPATALVLALAGPLHVPDAAAHCAGNHTGNHPHCDGGGGSTESGEPIPLDCAFSDLVDDTLFSDTGLGYSDGVDKVRCSTGGTSQPNLSGVALDTVTKGPVHKAVRFFDLALNPCVVDFECDLAPAEIFTFGSLESGVVASTAYSEQDHIQNLTPGETYSMAGRIALSGYADRWNLQFMGRVIPADFHQGIWCDLEQNPGFDPADAVSEDLTVYLWPDDDGNGVADGYTLTTGTIAAGGSPPVVTPGTRLATICSNTGSLVCGGPSNGDLCNLTGFVEVQYTLHTENQ